MHTCLPEALNPGFSSPKVWVCRLV